MKMNPGKPFSPGMTVCAFLPSLPSVTATTLFLHPEVSWAGHIYLSAPPFSFSIQLSNYVSLPSIGDVQLHPSIRTFVCYFYMLYHPKYILFLCRAAVQQGQPESFRGVYSVITTVSKLSSPCEDFSLCTCNKRDVKNHEFRAFVKKYSLVMSRNTHVEPSISSVIIYHS